jgi:hypothetical protein
MDASPLRRLWRAITLGAIGGGKHFDDKPVTRWPVGRNFQRVGQVVTCPKCPVGGVMLRRSPTGADRLRHPRPLTPADCTPWFRSSTSGPAWFSYFARFAAAVRGAGLSLHTALFQLSSSHGGRIPWAFRSSMAFLTAAAMRTSLLFCRSTFCHGLFMEPA